MGMDILRCRTPGMVKKEIVMHLIAYNAIRLRMFEAATAVEQLPRRFSFKASIQALRQWEPLFNRIDLKDRERRRLLSSLRDAIAATVLTIRPGRKEPRCVKRRPKRVQPAGRGLEVLVGRAEGVGGMDAAVKPTWRYSRLHLA
jgi:hypothetical protein